MGRLDVCYVLRFPLRLDIVAPITDVHSCLSRTTFHAPHLSTSVNNKKTKIKNLDVL